MAQKNQYIRLKAEEIAARGSLLTGTKADSMGGRSIPPSEKRSAVD